MSITFDTVRLRANPFYRAVPWNRVAPDAREALLTLADGYGVLIPRDGAALPLVAIDRDTALLFLTLQEAGPAPDFVFAAGCPSWRYGAGPAGARSCPGGGADR